MGVSGRDYLGRVSFSDINHQGLLTWRALLYWGMYPLLGVLSEEEVRSELQLIKVAPVMWVVRAILGKRPLVECPQVEGGEVQLEGAFQQRLWEADRQVLGGSGSQKRWWWEVGVNLYGRSDHPNKSSEQPLTEPPVARVRSWLALTRPFGKVGERHLESLPESLLKRLPLHSWIGGWPDWRGLSLEPVCPWQELLRADPQQLRWGPQQTDGLGHVNMNESLAAVEGYGTQLLARNGVPLFGIRPAGLRAYFRKPLFAGDLTKVHGKLWRRRNSFMFSGGLWASSIKNGRESIDASPALFCRLRWHLL